MGAGSLAGNIRLVLFDLGGTLMYQCGPWDEIYPHADQALWRSLHAAGVTLDPPDLYQDYPTFFALYYDKHRGDLNEPTSLRVLDDLLRAKGFQLTRQTLRQALRAMFGVTQVNWIPEADALPALRALQQMDMRIGMISNASDDDNTQALIDKGDFRPCLEHIVSSAAFGRRKPDPAIFRAALLEFGIQPEQAVMVGDEYEADIFGATSVGMKSIWITRRAREQAPGNATAVPDAVVSTLAEIPALLHS